jgi:large subunit ribosomal protein L27Ae
VDKLWTLVPEEHKKDLKEDSQIVPVVNVLNHGYSKVLGNGQLVLATCNVRWAWTEIAPRLPNLPIIVKARYVSEKAE